MDHGPQHRPWRDAIPWGCASFGVQGEEQTDLFVPHLLGKAIGGTGMVCRDGWNSWELAGFCLGFSKVFGLQNSVMPDLIVLTARATLLLESSQDSLDNGQLMARQLELHRKLIFQHCQI